jgi:hypothetical protein
MGHIWTLPDRVELKSQRQVIAGAGARLLRSGGRSRTGCVMISPMRAALRSLLRDLVQRLQAARPR